MSRARGDTGRRQMDRIAKLDRRLRALGQKAYPSIDETAEMSSLEWAIPILEQHVRNTYGDTLPKRTVWMKQEKKKIKELLVERDGQECYLCGKYIHYAAITIDHVLPLALGGKNELDNYKIAHWQCNGEKGNLLLSEYVDLKERGQL